jgi:hypothetical protein
MNQNDIKNSLWNKIFDELHYNICNKPNTKETIEKASNIVNNIIDEVSCLDLFAVDGIKNIENS